MLTRTTADTRVKLIPGRVPRWLLHRLRTNSRLIAYQHLRRLAGDPDNRRLLIDHAGTLARPRDVAGWITIPYLPRAEAVEIARRWAAALHCQAIVGDSDWHPAAVKITLLPP